MGGLMRQHKKVMAAALTIWIAATGLAGCGDGGSQTPTQAPESAPASETKQLSGTSGEGNAAADSKETAAPSEGENDAKTAEKPYQGMNMVIFTGANLYEGYADFQKPAADWSNVLYHAINEWCEENEATWSEMSTNDSNVLMSAIAAGKAPDLYYGYRQFPLLPNLGLVQPINDYYDRLAEKYGAEHLELLKYKSDYYGINLPWNETTALRYDRTLFEELGVKTPKEYFLEGNWTWDTFRNCVKEVSKDLDGDGEKDIYGAGFYQFTSCFAPPVAMDVTGTLSSLLNTDKNRDLYQMLYEEFTLNKTMTQANQTSPGVDAEGKRYAFGVAPVDTYNPFGLYYQDSEGHVIEVVPIPEYEKDAPDISVKVNFQQLMIPTGAQNIDASVSLMDYMVECGVAAQIVPSGLTDYTFTGLRGSTADSAKYIELKKAAYEEALNAALELPEYDEDYIKALRAYWDSKPHHIEWTFSGVTFALTNSKDWEKLWTLPAATSIAELYEKHQAACETYNSKFIFD